MDKANELALLVAEAQARQKENGGLAQALREVLRVIDRWEEDAHRAGKLYFTDSEGGWLPKYSAADQIMTAIEKGLTQAPPQE